MSPCCQRYVNSTLVITPELPCRNPRHLRKIVIPGVPLSELRNFALFCDKITNRVPFHKARLSDQPQPLNSSKVAPVKVTCAAFPQPNPCIPGIGLAQASLSLPAQNVSLSQRFNSGKGNVNEERETRQVHAGVQAGRGAACGVRAEHRGFPHRLARTPFWCASASLRTR